MFSDLFFSPTSNGAGFPPHFFRNTIFIPLYPDVFGPFLQPHIPDKFKSARGWIFVDVYSIIIAVSCWFYMENCEEYGEKYFK